jgi:hypothetical protein
MQRAYSKRPPMMKEAPLNATSSFKKTPDGKIAPLNPMRSFKRPPIKK